jgi:hypothetical protein
MFDRGILRSAWNGRKSHDARGSAHDAFHEIVHSDFTFPYNSLPAKTFPSLDLYAAKLRAQNAGSTNASFRRDFWGEALTSGGGCLKPRNIVCEIYHKPLPGPVAGRYNLLHRKGLLVFG